MQQVTLVQFLARWTQAKGRSECLLERQSRLADFLSETSWCRLQCPWLFVTRDSPLGPLCLINYARNHSSSAHRLALVFPLRLRVDAFCSREKQQGPAVLICMSRQIEQTQSFFKDLIKLASRTPSATDAIKRRLDDGSEIIRDFFRLIGRGRGDEREVNFALQKMYLAIAVLSNLSHTHLSEYFCEQIIHEVKLCVDSQISDFISQLDSEDRFRSMNKATRTSKYFLYFISGAGVGYLREGATLFSFKFIQAILETLLPKEQDELDNLADSIQLSFTYLNMLNEAADRISKSEELRNTSRIPISPKQRLEIVEILKKMDSSMNDCSPLIWRRFVWYNSCMFELQDSLKRIYTFFEKIQCKQEEEDD